MKGLSTFRGSSGPNHIVPPDHGESESSKELVLLDALTGEAFRFVLPHSHSGSNARRKQDARLSCSQERAGTSSWLSLDRYIHQLLPSIPPLTRDKDVVKDQGKHTNGKRPTTSDCREPQRCLCFVEATGRSLSAEAAASAAGQGKHTGSSSGNYASSFPQLQGSLSLIFLRPELLLCLGHSSSGARAPPAQATAVTAAVGEQTFHVASSALEAPFAFDSNIKTSLEKTQAWAVTSSARTGEAVSLGVGRTIDVGEKHDPDLNCACSSAGFGFPSAPSQQRLASGELKALRAAALLDSDASFRSFGSNIIAAVPVLCMSRDAAAVAADLHVRLGRQQRAADVVIHALMRHAELALKWAEALKLRLHQQAKAQEDLVIGFDQVLLRLQRTPLDPVLLMLERLKSEAEMQWQEQQGSGPVSCATDSTSRASPATGQSRQQDCAETEKSEAAFEGTSTADKLFGLASLKTVSTATPGRLAARTGTARSTTKSSATPTQAVRPTASISSMAVVASGEGPPADAFHSPGSISDGSHSSQHSPVEFMAASAGSCVPSAASGGHMLSHREDLQRTGDRFPIVKPEQRPVHLGSPVTSVEGEAALLEHTVVSREKCTLPAAAAAGKLRTTATLSGNPAQACRPATLDTATGATELWATAGPIEDTSNSQIRCRRVATNQSNPLKVRRQSSSFSVRPPSPMRLQATVPTPIPEIADVTVGKTATSVSVAADDSAASRQSAASLLNVPAIRAFAASVFADRTAVLQQVEQLQQDIQAAACTFRSSANQLLAAAAETRAAMSALLVQQQELTSVHTRAFAAVAKAAPAPPIAYSNFAPQQLRVLAAHQGAAMEDLQQLQHQQQDLTEQQRAAWTRHCRNQLHLICTCLRGRLVLRQYHEKGLACSSRAQRVDAALVQLRRIYACPAAFAAAARETARRLVFAISFRKAAELAQGVLQRMQQEEQQQRLQFLDRAAASLPAAAFWPLLRIVPQEINIALPEADEPLMSFINQADLTAVIEEWQRLHNGEEAQGQQHRQRRGDNTLLQALLLSDLARSRQYSGKEMHVQQQQQQQHQKHPRSLLQQGQLPIPQNHDYPSQGQAGTFRFTMHSRKLQELQHEQQPLQSSDSATRGTDSASSRVHQLDDKAHGEAQTRFNVEIPEVGQQQKQPISSARVPNSPHSLQVLRDGPALTQQRWLRNVPQLASNATARRTKDQEQRQVPLYKNFPSSLHDLATASLLESSMSLQESVLHPRREATQSVISENQQSTHQGGQHLFLQQLLLQQQLQQHQRETAKCQKPLAHSLGCSEDVRGTESSLRACRQQQQAQTLGQAQQSLPQPLPLLQLQCPPKQQQPPHVPSPYTKGQAECHHKYQQEYFQVRQQENNAILLHERECGLTGLLQQGSDVPLQPTNRLTSQLQKQLLMREKQRILGSLNGSKVQPGLQESHPKKHNVQIHEQQSLSLSASCEEVHQMQLDQLEFGSDCVQQDQQQNSLLLEPNPRQQQLRNHWSPDTEGVYLTQHQLQQQQPPRLPSTQEYSLGQELDQHTPHLQHQSVKEMDQSLWSRMPPKPTGRSLRRGNSQVVPASLVQLPPWFTQLDCNETQLLQKSKHRTWDHYLTVGSERLQLERVSSSHKQQYQCQQVQREQRQGHECGDHRLLQKPGQRVDEQQHDQLSEQRGQMQQKTLKQQNASFVEQQQRMPEQRQHPSEPQTTVTWRQGCATSRKQEEAKAEEETENDQRDQQHSVMGAQQLAPQQQLVHQEKESVLEGASGSVALTLKLRQPLVAQHHPEVQQMARQQRRIAELSGELVEAQHHHSGLVASAGIVSGDVEDRAQAKTVDAAPGVVVARTGNYRAEDQLPRNIANLDALRLRPAEAAIAVGVTAGNAGNIDVPGDSELVACVQRNRDAGTFEAAVAEEGPQGAYGSPEQVACTTGNAGTAAPTSSQFRGGDAPEGARPLRRGSLAQSAGLKGNTAVELAALSPGAATAGVRSLDKAKRNSF